MKMRGNYPLLTLMVGALLMGSCTLGDSPAPSQGEAPTATPEPRAAQPTTAPLEATEASEAGGSAEASPTSQATPAPAGLPDQGPIPTGSSALKASDPDSVNLADGDPKLVEFFAFW